MIIIGLTGSIGMGKSFAAKIFQDMGAGVFDADAAIHKILAEDKEVKAKIKKEFPDSIVKGGVDRKALGGLVFGDKDKLKKLEEILHPLVWEREKEFFKVCRRNKIRIAVLDIPLLFETGSYKKCDYVVVVEAPASVQEDRVNSRGNVEDEKFKQINDLQMPTSEKIKMADFVIRTGLDKRFVIKQVQQIISQL